MEMKLLLSDPPTTGYECRKCHGHGYQILGPSSLVLAADLVMTGPVHVPTLRQVRCVRCGDVFDRDISRC